MSSKMVSLLNIVILLSQFPVAVLLFEQKHTEQWILSLKGGYSEVLQIAKNYRLNIVREVIPGHYIIQNMQPFRKIKFQDILREPLVTELQKDVLLRRYHKAVDFNYFNDPEWKNMWYLNEQNGILNMNVKQTWEEGFTGKGVTIAVVDDGVDISHTDLRTKYQRSLSYDFFDNDEQPIPTDSRSRHGTKCAGIAVAEKNNSNCVVGVAFDAKLAVLRFMDGYASLPSSEARSLSYKLNSIDIYSNSWGVQDGTGFDGPTSVVKESIKKGIKEGRSGLGNIYVWAAGNGGQTDNCNGDGYVNSIYTIAITSTQYDNYSPYYVENCPAALAAAHSADDYAYMVITTGVGNVCENFTGTSASTPIAAGIIALTLQANKNLTWRDVQHLIVRTSNKYSLIDLNWKINGAGRSVSSKFGFGLLNAYAMTKMAKNWTTVKEQHICLSLKKVIKLPMLGTKTAVDTMITDGCNETDNDVKFTEHVQVSIEFSANQHGHVVIFLTSPSGMKSQLLSPRNFDTNKGYKKWTFMTVQFWDENPIGKWKLEMKMLTSAGKGELKSWQMYIYGTGDHLKSGDERSNDDLLMWILLGIACGYVSINIIALTVSCLLVKKRKLKVKSNFKN